MAVSREDIKQIAKESADNVLSRQRICRCVDWFLVATTAAEALEHNATVSDMSGELHENLKKILPKEQLEELESEHVLLQGYLTEGMAEMTLAGSLGKIHDLCGADISEVKKLADSGFAAIKKRDPITARDNFTNLKGELVKLADNICEREKDLTELKANPTPEAVPIEWVDIPKDVRSDLEGRIVMLPEQIRPTVKKVEINPADEEFMGVTEPDAYVSPRTGEMVFNSLDAAGNDTIFFHEVFHAWQAANPEAFSILRTEAEKVLPRKILMGERLAQLFSEYMRGTLGVDTTEYIFMNEHFPKPPPAVEEGKYWFCPKCGRKNERYPYSTKCSRCGFLRIVQQNPTIGGNPKELWQMTKEEFHKDWATHSPKDPSVSQRDYDKLVDTWRRSFIQRAIKDGKPVPAEVLADYPELGKGNPSKLEYGLFFGDRATQIKRGELNKIIAEIPDVNDTALINYWVTKGNEEIYIEGWCDACIAGWGYPLREEERAYETFYEVGERLTPGILQRKAKERGLELLEGGWIGLPDAENLFGVTYGIYQKTKGNPTEYVTITDPGKTTFKVGEIVSREAFDKENERVRKLGEAPATGR